MLQLRILTNLGDACTVSMKEKDEVLNDLWSGFIAVFFNNLIISGKKETRTSLTFHLTIFSSYQLQSNC